MAKTHDGTEYNRGETITFSITVLNIYDEAKDITITEQDGVTITGESSFKAVAPGERVSTTATYTVTETDILEGHFANHVDVTMADKTWPGDDDVELKEPEATLEVTKEAADGPYALGSSISYTVTVKNTGNVTVSGIELEDTLVPSVALEDTELIPGASTSITYTYIVTEADVLNGSVANRATVSGEDPNGSTVTGTASEEVTTDPADPSFTVEKQLTNLPDKGYFVQGETAEFDIIVTNNGNLTLTDITLKEELDGSAFVPGTGYRVNGGTTAVIASLAPGDSITIIAQRPVTVADLDQQLVNVVTGTADGPDENHNPDPEGTEVDVPTDSSAAITIDLSWDDRDNAYDTRPDKVTVTVLADGVAAYTVDMNDANSWTEVLRQLPRHNADGSMITYIFTA